MSNSWNSEAWGPFPKKIASCDNGAFLEFFRTQQSSPSQQIGEILDHETDRHSPDPSQDLS